jgi:hypothetical protein
MAGTVAHSSSTVWILLSEAVALVAVYVGSTAAAKEFVLHYLRAGDIRWIHWKQEGLFDESETYSWFLRHSRIHDRFDPDVDTENRWWTFWKTNDLVSRARNRQVTVDWEQSNAICTASESEFGPASHYKLSLIRLHREDVIDKLRLAGLLPWEPSQADDEDAVEPEPVSVSVSVSVSEPEPESVPVDVQGVSATATAGTLGVVISEPELKRRRSSLRRQMALAIMARRFPNGVDVGTSAVEDQIKADWADECKTRNVSARDYPPPEWDMTESLITEYSQLLRRRLIH